MELQETSEHDSGLSVYRVEGARTFDDVLFSLRVVQEQIEQGVLPDLFWVKDGPTVPFVRGYSQERGACHLRPIAPSDVSEEGIHRPSRNSPFLAYACPSRRPAIPFRMNFWRSSRVGQFMDSQGVDGPQLELYSDASLRPDEDHPEAHVAAGIALMTGSPNVSVDWRNRQGQMLVFHPGMGGWYFQRPPRTNVFGYQDQILKITPMRW